MGWSADVYDAERRGKGWIWRILLGGRKTFGGPIRARAEPMARRGRTSEKANFNSMVNLGRVGKSGEFFMKI